MELAQGSQWGIIHHEKWQFVGDAKVQHAHNMRMHKLSDSARLRAKFIHIFAGQLCVQHFDSCLRAEMHMLGKINIGESTLTYFANQAIVAKLLAYAIHHSRLSSLNGSASCYSITRA